MPSVLSCRGNVPPALLCFILIASCGPDGASAPDLADLGGPDRTTTIERTPVWAIGGVDAPAWAAFGEVSDLAFDGRGHLHVLDGSAGRVTVIDGHGERVRSYGAPGQGPGELLAPGALVVRADGSTALYDYGHAAWLHYDTLGAFAGQSHVGGEETGAPGADAFPHPDGSIIARGSGVVESGSGHAIPVLRYARDASGDVLFEAWALPPPPPPVVDRVTLDGGSIAVRVPRERGFEPGLHMAVLPDGRIAVADSFTWRVELFDPTGAPVGTLERPLEPLEVTDALQEAERERRLAAVARGELPGFMISGRDGSMSPADRTSVREFMEARLENMVFTAHLPGSASPAPPRTRSPRASP